MGPWGALIMSFFGACLFVWGSVLSAGWRNPLLLLPVIVFACIGEAARHKIKSEAERFYSPSEHAAKVMSWASAAEGIGIPIVALTLANTGHQSQVLPGIAAVVGLHFIPIAYMVPFRPLYAPAACLLLVAAIGFSLDQPVGSILTGVASALTLWATSLFALWRARKGRWSATA